MTGYEAAVNMYHREHDRWNQWMLFFFGSIASMFVLREQLKTSVPLWAPAFLSGMLSLLWVAVALSIRASTHAWRETVKEIEAHTDRDGPAFRIFEKHLQSFDRWDDLRKTLTHWRTETFRRVTRVLTLLGVLASILFFLIAMASIFGCLRSEGDLSRTGGAHVVVA